VRRQTGRATVAPCSAAQSCLLRNLAPPHPGAAQRRAPSNRTSLRRLYPILESPRPGNTHHQARLKSQLAHSWKCLCFHTVRSRYNFPVLATRQLPLVGHDLQQASPNYLAGILLCVRDIIQSHGLPHTLLKTLGCTRNPARAAHTHACLDKITPGAVHGLESHIHFHSIFLVASCAQIACQFVQTCSHMQSCTRQAARGAKVVQAGRIW